MKVITLRIDNALAEQLKTLAWEQRTSMNKLLTRLVREELQSVKTQYVVTPHGSGFGMVTEASDGDLAQET